MPYWYHLAIGLRAEGLLFKEIARTLGKPLSTVLSAVARSRMPAKPPQKRHAPATVGQIITAYRLGEYVPNIAARLGLSKNAVIGVANRAGVKHGECV